MNRGSTVRSLTLWLCVCLVAEAVGAALTVPGIQSGWYRSLVKPPWTPTDWIFGPVWFALFAAMGVAGWLVWEREAGLRRHGRLWLFGAQLAANVVWSGLFFTLRDPGAAMADMLVLWVLVLAMTFAFWRVDRTAGLLLVPYAGWLTFAAVLNYSVWRLNA